MRFVQLDRYLQFRKELDKRIAIYFAAIIGLVNFIFFIFDSVLNGVLWGSFMFLVSFSVTYGIRLLTNKAVDKNREKVSLFGMVIDVTLKGEFGLLSIGQKQIKFVSLQKFGVNKPITLTVDEDLFIGYSKDKFGIMQKLKFGKALKCSIAVKEMTGGPFYIFDFYDVEGTYDRVVQLLDSIRCFKPEKYLGK